MTTLEAIDKRKSRRTYLDMPIQKEKLDVLQSLIEQYNKEENLSIQLIEDGSEAFKGFRKSFGMFKGVRTIIAMIGKKNETHLKEKIGYYGELLVLEATKMDLGTCWVGGTFSNDDNVVKIQPDESLICVITVGYVDKESLKEKVIHGIATRKAKTIHDLYTTDCPVSERFLKGVEAVLKAPSANNRKKVKIEYREGEMKAFVENTNKFDLVDLGIAKAHFQIAANTRFDWGNGGKIYKMSY